VTVAVGTCLVVPVATSTPAGAEAVIPVTGTAGMNSPQSVCYDSSGDLFVSDDVGDVYVDPASSGTIFGRSVTAGTLTAVVSADAGLGAIACYDGMLFFTSSAEGFTSVDVLSNTPTTVFGTPVSPDSNTQIYGTSDDMDALTFDGNGNMYWTDSGSGGNGGVWVLANSSGTLFGHSVTAGDASEIGTVSGSWQPDGLGIDPSGNLFIADSANQVLSVMAASSGTLFGQPVTANTVDPLESGLSLPTGNEEDLAVDGSGNVYLSSTAGVSVLSRTTGSLVGTSVASNTVTPLDLNAGVTGVTFDRSGHLVMADSGDDAVVTATTAVAHVTKVTFSGGDANPTVTVSGTGFGSEPAGGYGPGCSASGTNLPYSQLIMVDDTQQWQAGWAGDCIGLEVSSWTKNQIVFTFGSWYTGTEDSNGTELQPGDSYVLGVEGSYLTGRAPLVPSITTIDPTSGPDTGGTPVTITGTNFTGTTAVDFGSIPASSFTVNSNTSITAVDPAHSAEAVAVTVTTWYTSPQNPGDEFTYTPAVQANYTCALPAPLGPTTFPVVLSEEPAAPASIDAGGTFQTTLAAQVTVPAAVINAAITDGTTRFTINAQSVTVDGQTSGGAPSGAVSPNTETEAASNLPQTDRHFAANTPFTYQTSYDPVTWDTGAGTGVVDFVPGTIDITRTEVTPGSSSTAQLNCTAPQGVAALTSTTVDPAPSSPTFQVPSPTPPLQNQVSPNTDGGWGVTISNTSTSTVTGVTAGVNVTDGGAPLTYDLAGMAASGTTCSPAGSGQATCSVGNLPEGGSALLDLLVNTGGLAPGTAITGSATVTSTNAAGHTTTLSEIEVVVVQSGNGAAAVAVPGIALASTRSSLSEAKASVTLTLPTGQNAPPVAVTLKSFAPSDAPALCPPDGLSTCEGNVVEAFGDFGAYTDNQHPITAVLKVFYGTAIPSGSVYFLKPDGSTVDQLAVCTMGVNGYDTPCLASSEQVGGTAQAGNLYTQDTVYFTGNDPVMGRR
jgi:sugar lactone lactonase YvrE